MQFMAIMIHAPASSGEAVASQLTRQIPDLTPEQRDLCSKFINETDWDDTRSSRCRCRSWSGRYTYSFTAPESGSITDTTRESGLLAAFCNFAVTIWSEGTRVVTSGELFTRLTHHHGQEDRDEQESRRGAQLHDFGRWMGLEWNWILICSIRIETGCLQANDNSTSLTLVNTVTADQNNTIMYFYYWSSGK